MCMCTENVSHCSCSLLCYMISINLGDLKIISFHAIRLRQQLSKWYVFHISIWYEESIHRDRTVLKFRIPWNITHFRIISDVPMRTLSTYYLDKKQLALPLSFIPRVWHLAFRFGWISKLFMFHSVYCFSWRPMCTCLTSIWIYF